MRVFAVPILRDRWAYYCHSTLPSTSRLSRAVEWSSKKWEQLGEAEPKTWKRRLYDSGTHLMNQLDYQEWFLKNVPMKEEVAGAVEKATVHYASLLDGAQVEAHLRQLLKEREPYHKKYMYYSAYWVPISCTFALVPLIPNIPLAYNLFRLYSHYKAYKGAQHLQSLIQRDALEYSPSRELDRILRDVKFASSEDVQLPPELAKLFQESRKRRPTFKDLERDIPGVLDLEKITELAHHFQSPGMDLELKRARFQMLSALARERFGLPTK